MERHRPRAGVDLDGDACGDGEDLVDQRRCEHGVGRAEGHEPALVEHGDVVAERRGDVEVVKGGDHGRPESAHDAHQVELVGDVEVVRRLVEDEDPPVLRESAGEHHPLALTAGEPSHQAVAEVVHVGGAQRLVDDALILPGVPAERRTVRRAADEDRLPHGQVELRGRVLQHHRHGAGERARRQQRGIRPVDQDAPAVRALTREERAQEGRLPAAVRPEESDDAPGGDLEVDSVQHDATAAHDAHAVEPHAHRSNPARSPSLRISQRKKGAPTNAVRMPRGISVGIATVRASRSAIMRNSAPPRTVTGSIRR